MKTDCRYSSGSVMSSVCGLLKLRGDERRDECMSQYRANAFVETSLTCGFICHQMAHEFLFFNVRKEDLAGLNFIFHYTRKSARPYVSTNSLALFRAVTRSVAISPVSLSECQISFCYIWLYYYTVSTTFLCLQV
jgi:hypothetical protein